MRCQCCNCNLSDYESVIKHSETGEYLDTCLVCLEEIAVIPYTAPSTIPAEHGWDDEQELTLDNGDDDAYQDAE